MTVIHNHPVHLTFEEKQKKLSELHHTCLTTVLRLREGRTSASSLGLNDTHALPDPHI